MTFSPGESHYMYKHGYCGSRTYRTWVSMKTRCFDKSYENYHNYGGRGITICNRWLESFENFLEDMGERPPNKTIDRINPDGNYCPENCRWADNRTQSLNRRNTNVIKFKGQETTLREIGKKYGIPQTTIYRRYKQGVRGDDLISKDNRNKLITGEHKPCSKLTDMDAVEIIKKVMCGLLHREVAEIYSVSQTTITNIVNGRIYPKALEHYKKTEEHYSEVEK